MASIHRVESTAGATPVNAYLVEGEGGVVAVDGTLTVSGGRELRERVRSIGKPLEALVLTHAHPDHYGGVGEAIAASDAPVIAVKGVDEIIRRDDAMKEEILRPMFGEEWPAERVFPSQIVKDGTELAFGDIELAVRDLGPSESPHDSIWFLGEDRRTVFSGDQAYNHMHSFLADGFWEQWLANIEALSAELPPNTVLHPGHGDPAEPSLLSWQRGYIERFLEAVHSADWADADKAKQGVVDAMSGYLESEQLRFLMELSIEPVAGKLGVVPEAAGEPDDRREHSAQARPRP